MPFPILEDKIKVLPHSCFICSKAFVRKNTLLKHYQEHSKELGSNLERLEEAKAEYLGKKSKGHTRTEAPNTDDIQYNGFDNECHMQPTTTDGTKVLPYSCFICNKSYVRESTLFKHYHEHPNELGLNLEHLEEATAKYMHEQKNGKIQYYGFQEECQPESITNEQNNNQNVIQNLDSNDIIITSLESSNIMVQNLDPANIVQHIDPSNVESLNPEADFSISILSGRETHECHVCEASFSALSSLRRHSFIHMKGQIFTCDVCKDCFPTKNELDSHSSIHSSSVQSFECWDCNKTFPKEYDLENHKFLEGHFTDTRHFCKICKIGFSHDKEYREHCNIHDRKKSCEVCNKLLSKFVNLKKHFLAHAGDEPHICQFCKARFFQKCALNMHFLKQHPREMKFVCYICIESFSSEGDLKKHKLQHTRFLCSRCGKSFDRTDQLESHKLTHKSKKRSYVCKECSMKFSSKPKLQDHKHEHTRKKIYVCNLCHNAFSEKIDFEEHKNLHEKTGAKQNSSDKRKLKDELEDVKNKKHFRKKETVLCDICEETVNFDDFEDHMLMHNKGRMHTCRVCSQSFTFKEDLEAHSKAIHENGKPFSCNICNEGFAFKSDLRQHKQIHNQKKVFSCKQCPEIFSEKSKLVDHNKIPCKKNLKHSCSTRSEKLTSKVNLIEHQHAHSADDCDDELGDFLCKYCYQHFPSKSQRSAHVSCCDKKSPHLCKNCNQRFKSKGELLEHKKVHSRRQPFICKVCNEGFKLKEDLEKHKKIHNTDPTYPCNICDKIFAKKESLREHKLSHKDEIVYICRVCDCTFENKADFKAHRVTHDIITHQCKVCSEIFSTRKELKRHYLKHILERPSLCRICNATFEQWGALRSHYLSHTRN